MILESPFCCIENVVYIEYNDDTRALNVQWTFAQRGPERERRRESTKYRTIRYQREPMKPANDGREGKQNEQKTDGSRNLPFVSGGICV